MIFEELEYEKYHTGSLNCKIITVWESWTLKSQSSVVNMGEVFWSFFPVCPIIFLLHWNVLLQFEVHEAI